MTQPLSMFVQDPGNPAYTMVYPYGLAGDSFSSGLTFHASSQEELRAAITGQLSVLPIYYHGVGSGEPLETATATPRPRTITLYLQPDTALSLDPEWQARAEVAGLGKLVGFAYDNVDVDTLVATWETSLGASRFSAMTVPPEAMSHQELLDQFLAGNLELRVTAGEIIGKAGPVGPAGSATEWVFGFHVFTTIFEDSGSTLPYAFLGTTGPVDPVAFYDEMRDLLVDGSEMVDTLMTRAPKGWPILPNTVYSASEAIQETAEHIYPWPALASLAMGYTLDDAQWAQVWANQRALYRRHLLATVAPIRLDAQSQALAQGMPRFSFNDSDAYNPIQLEALVEFYVNFNDPYGPVGLAFDPNDPYAPITSPLSPGDAGYQTVDLGQGTGWHLIIIQSFGARKNLSGANAEASGSALVLLTSTERIEDQGQSWPVMYSLMRLNAGFDTIYLDGDTARASGVYRITDVDASAFTVTVDGAPNLNGQPSAWRIPAGVGGKLPPVDYNLGPGGSLGYDHHDGALFLVKDGQVHGVWRGSSYTSRSQFGYQYPLPSPRGNRRYLFHSHTSGGSPSINYAFRIKESEDQPDSDMSLPVRYYYYNQVRDGRSAGRLGHAIHRGYPGSTSSIPPAYGSGSMGCMPILQFFDFREAMIQQYIDERRRSGLSVDPRLEELAGLDEPQSELAWCLEHPADSDCKDILPDEGAPAGPVTQISEAWSAGSGTIQGNLWVIHPHEVPRHQSEY